MEWELGSGRRRAETIGKAWAEEGVENGFGVRRGRRFVPERESAAAQRVEETVTDYADRFAGRGVGEEGGVGFAKHNDTGAGVQKQLNGATGLWRETKTKERQGAIVCNDLGMDEGATVVWGALDAQESAVGAEDERLRAHDRDKAMIAEASLREYVFARLCKDDGLCEESSGSRRVSRRVVK
jgi:hypothetical protein